MSLFERFTLFRCKINLRWWAHDYPPFPHSILFIYGNPWFLRSHQPIINLSNLHLCLIVVKMYHHIILLTETFFYCWWHPVSFHNMPFRPTKIFGSSLVVLRATEQKWDASRQYKSTHESRVLPLHESPCGNMSGLMLGFLWFLDSKAVSKNLMHFFDWTHLMVESGC